MTGGSAPLSLTLDKLNALGSTTVTIDEPFVKRHETYSGVPLAAVLGKAGIPDTATIDTIGLDEYHYISTARPMIESQAPDRHRAQRCADPLRPRRAHPDRVPGRNAAVLGARRVELEPGLDRGQTPQRARLMISDQWLSPPGPRLTLNRGQQVVAALLVLLLIALVVVGIQSSAQQRAFTDINARSEAVSTNMFFTVRDSLTYVEQAQQYLLGVVPRRDVQVARALLAQRLQVIATNGVDRRRCHHPGIPLGA